MVVWCRCPLSVEYYRRELTEHLALDVRLERIGFPRPNVTVYKGLTLADPETGRPLARFGAIEWQVCGQRSSMTCHEAELLDSSRLDLLAELVARRLRHFAGSQAVIEIDSQQLTVHLADGLGPVALTDVHAQMKKRGRRGERTARDFGISLGRAKRGAPVRISFDRAASPPGTATSTKIDTGPTPVPSRLIALGCPAWEAWGPTSNFRGKLWWQQRPTAGPAGCVTGALRESIFQSSFQCDRSID